MRPVGIVPALFKVLHIDPSKRQWRAMLVVSTVGLTVGIALLLR